MKRNVLRVFIGVTALAMSLSACTGSVEDIKSMIQSAISNYSSEQTSSAGGESQNAANSSNAGNSSNASQPTSSGKTSDSSSGGQGGNSSSGGQGGNSSSSGSGGNSQSQPADKFQVTEDYWRENIQNSGYFGANSNITFVGETKSGGQKVADILVEVNYGDIHMQSFGEEFYLDLLQDGSIDYYEVDYETGLWGKDNIPAAYAGTFRNMFIEVIQPYSFSDFKYNSSTQAYEKDRFEMHPDTSDPTYTVTLTKLKFRFENNNFKSYEYDISTREGSGSGIIKGTKWGTTSFTFPQVGSQGGEPHGHGGEGEDPVTVDNPFYKVALKFNGISNFEALQTGVTEAQIIEKYKTARLDTFDDGTVENNLIDNCSYQMYYTANNVTFALLGKFSATKTKGSFVARTSYDSYSREYNFYLKDELKYMEVSYDDGRYLLNMLDIDNQGIFLARFTLELALESNEPIHLDLPQEPVNTNYTVTYDQWKDIFQNHKYINIDSNFTVAGKESLYGTEVNVTFMVDKGKFYRKQETSYGGNSEEYYEAKNNDLNAFNYYYYNPTDQIWTMMDAPFENMSWFDSSLGIIPFQFADFTYSETSNYYYCNKFSYEQYEGYTVELTKIYIYFDGGKLQKIEYTDNIQQKHTFQYSAYGSTSVVMPTTSTTHYEDDFANKLFVFNRIEASSAAFNLNSIPSFEGSTISLFNKGEDNVYPAEWYMSNGAMLQVEGSVTVSGSFEVHKDQYSGQFYVVLKAQNEVYGSIVEPSYLGSTKLYYDESAKELVYTEGGVDFVDAAGQKQYTSLSMYFKLSNDTPQHVIIPELPNNWNAGAVATALENLEVTSGSIPALNGVKSFNIETKEGGFKINCEMPSQVVAKKLFEQYENDLNKDYYKVYDESYINVIGYKPQSGQFQFSLTLAGAVITIDVIKLESLIPGLDYPESDIAAFLTANNITDSVPSFKRIQGSQYFVFMTNNETSGQLAVMVGTDELEAGLTSARRIISTAGYSEKVVGKNTFYVSENEQLALRFITYADLNNMFYIEFLPGSAASVPTYPKDKINAFLKERGIDGDPIPELPLVLDNGYEFVDSNGLLYTELDSETANKCIEDSAKLLKENNFTEETIGGRLCYVSPNRISYIGFNTYSGYDESSVYLYVVFEDARELPSPTYPTALITRALNGTTDSFPNFSAEGAAYYYTAPFSGDWATPEGTLNVLIEEGDGVETLVENFRNLLLSEEYGYKLYETLVVSNVDDEGELYVYDGIFVSPNKQIAVMIEGGGDSYEIKFINLKMVKILQISEGESGEDEITIESLEIDGYTAGWDLAEIEEYFFDGYGIVTYSDESQIEVAADQMDITIDGDPTAPGLIVVNFSYTDDEGRTATAYVSVELFRTGDDEGGEEGGEEEEVTYTLHLVNYSTYRVTENRYLRTIINGEVYDIYGIDDIQEREAFELSGVPTDTRVLTIYCIDGSSDFDSTDASTFIDSTQVRIVSSSGGEIDPNAPIQLMMHFDKLPEYVEPQIEE